MPTRFTYENPLYKPLKFSHYAPAMFAEYLKSDHNIDYYDFDAYLLKKYTTFENFCENFKYPHDFDNAIELFKHPLWPAKIHNIVDNNLNLHKKYKYILASIVSYQDAPTIDISPTSYLNIMLLKWLRYVYPDSKIVVGGYNASMLQTHIKKLEDKSFIDILHIGTIPNEEALRQLLVDNKVGNAGRLHKEHRMSSILPKNTQDLKYSYNYILDYYNIPKEGLNIPSDWFFQASFNTFYGCTNKCAFCSSSTATYHRGKSQDIFDNIERLVDQGVNNIFFKDTCINPSRKIADEMCNWFIRKNMKQVTWSNSCQYKFVDEDFFKMCYEAGCRHLSFGAESVNNRMLKYINKGVTKDQILEGTYWCHKSGIWTLLNFIFGLPYDDEHSTSETIHFILKNIEIVNTVAINSFYLTYNSEFYTNPEKYDLIIDPVHFIKKHKNFDGDDKVLTDNNEKNVTFHYDLYRESKRFDYDQIERYKKGLYKSAFDLLIPYNRGIPQHLLFALYKCCKNKQHVMDIIKTYYRKDNEYITNAQKQLNIKPTRFE
jgi:radical SAM superfamily enzyme YgiQ (UPF0313 family)